ncbi:MAG: Maf family protein [Paracoccaceae bacterium]
MSAELVLASGSTIRAQMLRQANVPFTVQLARVDEQTVKQALLAEEAPPRDIADALAELKARKISDKLPGLLVLGCDQVLDFEGTLLSKPNSPAEAIEQIRSMRGKRHMLLSAAVICKDGQPIWRHVGVVRLRMRMVSDAYVQDYVTRNWESIRHSVGGYKLEEEGVRLFSGIDGDYFNVLGMPLIELLNYLALQGVIAQ